jgi:hypothetical protein
VRRLGDPLTRPADTGFVPADFAVPARLDADGLRLRMLTIHDVVKDYDAVMSSVAHLENVWPGSGWPQGLTLEQNLVDLGWHQKEFQRRRSFAYTVVDPQETRVLGCVYVYPSAKAGYDAMVFFWVRQSELASGLDERLSAVVRPWIHAAWPFEHPAYPGRDIDWDAWRAIPDTGR